MYTIEQKKIGLSNNDDKRVWTGNKSVPYGYEAKIYDENVVMKKIIKNCANRVNITIDKFLTFLGCTVEDFKEHLIKNLPKYCSFINYGTGWNIDHHIPISSSEKVDKLCQYTNLLPMTVKENSSKGGANRMKKISTI